MGDFLTVLKTYSLPDILVILAATYLMYKFIKKEIAEYRAEKSKSKRDYHEEQSRIEDRDETIDNRLKKLEKFSSADKAKVDGIAVRLDQIDETTKDHSNRLNEIGETTSKNTAKLETIDNAVEEQKAILDDLSVAVSDLKLDSWRKVILEAPAQCLDMKKPVSAEFYNDVMKTYHKYEAELKKRGLENSQADLSAKVVQSTWLQRIEAGMMTEQLYLEPDKAANKLREVGDNISRWWDEDFNIKP